MAGTETEDWFIGEVGSLNIGTPALRVTYHSSLNTLLVATKDSRLRVIDVTSGAVLQNSDLSATQTTNGIQCVYLASQDKLLFSNGYAISVRRDLNGVMLLDTALQTPVSSTDDVVKVELPLPDASQLFKSLMAAEMAGVDSVEDVLHQLETEIDAAQHATKHNHKVAKWATVCLKLPYFALKTVCSSLVTELKRSHQNTLGLSVASAISDRLLYLMPNSQDGGHNSVDRSLMYSEAARRETFAKWPHMNYKWALPDPMAKAGFYHQPNSTGDDRAMCFTCNVCLVCWEPTDEPWSEHERHSSSCPFVKGEHTQNVPLSVTYATEPAKPHGEKTSKISCISTISNCDMFATSTLHGSVVLWDCSRILKKCAHFHIDPLENIFPYHLGSTSKSMEQAFSTSQESSSSESSQESVMEAQTWSSQSKNDDQSEDNPKPSDCKGLEAKADVVEGQGKNAELESQLKTDTKSVGTSQSSAVAQLKSGSSDSTKDAQQTCTEAKILCESDPMSIAEVDVVSHSCMHEQSHAEVIEVKGAWLKPDLMVPVVEVPLNDDTAPSYMERHRPSHDVVVSALSVVGPYRSIQTATNSDIPVQPSLISGVLIRMDNQALNLAPSTSNASLSEKSDVQTLNQVNQAISEETIPAIIPENDVSSSDLVMDERCSTSRGSFHPYILVHHIGHGKKGDLKNGSKEGTSKSCAVEAKDKSAAPEMAFVEGIIKDYTPLTTVYESSPSSSVTGGPSAVTVKDSQDYGPSSVMSRSVHTSQPDGAIIQCIPLVPEIGPNQYIHGITPTCDGRHVIVVTAPKALDRKLSALHGLPSDGTSHGGGFILIYKLRQDMECMMLEESPCRMCALDNASDAVLSLSMLPPELGGGPSEVDTEANLHSTNKESVQGAMVVTTYGGETRIFILDNLKVVGTITPPEGEQFISAVFCTGIDRLCCCSKDGKLFFYVIGPCGLHMEDLALGLETAGHIAKHVSHAVPEDLVDSCSINTETSHKTGSLLVHQPLTPEILQSLYSLTQFENLVPRFCATVPPCWNEIQQEQQQRRHPQHLQQQGDSTQHTHTWRLYPDSTSWDEHLFELVIPKSCCVGHIDVKFSLFSLCTNVPNIQVTLLRQSMSKLGRVHGMDHNDAIPEECEVPSVSKDVDSRIEFNLNDTWTYSTDEDKAEQSDEAATSSSSMDDGGGSSMSDMVNPVTTRAFLDRHGAEILCGPVDLHQCVDMSGLGGVITLTGPELLKIKSRSFLLHIKAMISPDQEKNMTENGDKSKQDQKDKAPHGGVWKSVKRKDVGLCGKDRPTTPSSKQKPEPLKGCDWLQEISITVRRCKPVNIPRERLERVTMLEDQGLHERLLKLVCGEEENPASSDGGCLGTEQQRVLALEILTWICSILMYATDRSREQAAIMLTTERFLPSLIWSCYINANRSIAHQCTKFFTVLNEFGKNHSDQSLSTDFSSSLLTALLESLPLIPAARSAGALRWFFVLLNRVKCMDTTLTGMKCVEMLSTVASFYNERNNPLHALLKSRFGLYGHPLEPVLFDIDPPGLAKTLSSSTPSLGTYAGVVANNNNNNNGCPANTSLGPHFDEMHISDYLLPSSGEKNASSNGKCVPDQLSDHVFGLLEVEPLHFTCHAASDGTRVERIEQASGPTVGATTGMSGMSGTINFGADTALAASGNAMSSLSAATEHQLSILNQKHLQLLKLQQQKQKLEQKLAETSNKGVSTMYNNPELFPPTPKNTPFFMTPPVTPPNESYHNIYIGGLGPADPGKPPTNKDKGGEPKPNQLKSSFFWSQTQHLFQPMPPQALVIERLHSGARRFVVLDFGKPILLTDVVIPGCGDLQSLSIDIWTLGEDVDGHRLVVANDIGMRSLILNDLSPPPLCRYLKITTIGRHGGSAARSRIPLGSFYGHTFLPLWQANMVNHPLAAGSDQQPGPSSPCGQSDEQNQLMSELGLCMSLHEDIQCRYSLACNRLTSLLNVVQVPLNSVEHTLYYLKQGKKGDEDKRISQAYHDCMSLQLQLNLAECAIDRLQGMLGIRPPPVTGMDLNSLLQQASTDKLRVLSELLLDTLLGMTYPRPTIPHVPMVLYAMFTPEMCESLFRNLCVAGTKKMQINAGVLLVRLCSYQPWWGEFLSNTLQQYFCSLQPLVFPRDRVFLVLSALSQKSLPSSSGNQVLESLVTLLGSLLSPLLSQSSDTGYRTVPSIIDQNLVSWVLLFLSRSLDCASPGWSSDETTDKAAGSSNNKEKETGYGNNRWDFLQGEASLQKRSGMTRSRRSYHSRQHGLLWHNKRQLHVQQMKKEYLTEQASKALSSVFASSKPEVYKLDALNKTHAMIKKQYKQYSSKHFKDMLNIRRTAGEYLRKRDKDDVSQNGDTDTEDTDPEIQFVLSREKCILAVKGLVALLLSTDFTCHVDLFIVGCKVLARITSITRPVMILSEVMSQSELDELILLTCGAEYNHGNTNWGGSWAGHTISCLLQDILDGERMYGLTGERMTEDDVSASVISETDTSLQNSTTLPTIDEDNNTTATTAPEASSQAAEPSTSAESKSSPEEIAQHICQLSMLLQEEEGEAEASGSKQGLLSKIGQNKSDQHIIVHIGIDSKPSGGLLGGGDPKIPVFKMNKGKAGQQYNSVKPIPVPQGISTAMDARLELGVQLSTELKLKVMLSVDIESIQNALVAPLPPLPESAVQPVSLTQSHQQTDDEQLPEVSAYSLGQQQVTPSVDMLSTCFNALFCRRVNIDTLLLLWLTLNEDNVQEENGIYVFDSSHLPSIPLSETAVSSLLEAIVHAPYIPVRTWVLTFQCLTLLANLKYTPQSSEASAASREEKWLAQAMLADPNMMNVFLKFLSWTNNQGMVISTQQHTQVGPTAVKAFHDVLVRLQLRCAEDNEHLFRELLLKLIHQLSTDWGAFTVGIGPLDAQCSLLDHMLEQSYDKQVDVNNAISVIESVSQLVHQHIMSQECVGCRSSTEGTLSARSCFGGMFASVLRPTNSRSITGDANRDVLMSNLLSLINLLIQAPVPSRAVRRSTIASVSSMNEVFEQSEARASTDSPMTDISKINHSLSTAATATSHLANGVMTSTPNLPLSDEEKGGETDEQKTEHAAPCPNPQNLAAQMRKSCSHFWDSMNPEAEVKDVLIADCVLQHQYIMFHLMQALSYCTSSPVATIIGSNGIMNETFLNLDPLSVGDGIFQILCTLNRCATELPLILKPLYQYLSSSVPSIMCQEMCQLSEPLLWFALSVLDCESAITTFMSMGGIRVICENLVRSTHSVISTNPGLVSTIMQYLGMAKGKNSLPKKVFPVELDNNETLQNFAPIGTITSSSPSAGPADVLIEGVAPHRRARSAAWSFNFYPHEAWVDLIITLPCAILLREVHIQPHLASLSTCPSAVTLEVSRDGLTQIPVTSPLVTSGLNSIKIVLQKPEVVTLVTIRLHKPRDSTTIGLSQIRLLGTSAFGEMNKNTGSGSVRDDYVTKTSMSWLRLLHHCLTRCKSIQDQIAMAATPVQPLLKTCTSLLLSSGASLYVSQIESVLLTLGLQSADMGLGLIDHLLRNAQPSEEQGGLGRGIAIANESTVDLLYRLGTHQDQATSTRVSAMIDWLGDSARAALQKAHAGRKETFHHYGVPVDLSTAAPAHVHCVAAVLWNSQEEHVGYNLFDLVTMDLLSAMYEWAMVLSPTSTQKQAVDAVICSICYIHPEYFATLLEWMGIVISIDFSHASVTDDHKDSQAHQRQEALTDDLKATTEAQQKEGSIGQGLQPILLQEFGHMMLDESHLSTLAMACQSPICLRQLVGSNFLGVLCQGLYEFCVQELSKYGEPIITSEMFTDKEHPSSPTISPSASPKCTSTCSTSGTQAKHGCDPRPQEKRVTITADLVAPVLHFLADTSKEVIIKDWLGNEEGCIFWPVLLRLLCAAPATITRADSEQSSKYRTIQQRSAIEAAAIDFFSCVLSCHHGNQIQFANILCDVIRSQGSTVDEFGYRTSPLCGFMRCLFLQVLLEDEKVLVCLNGSLHLYKGHCNSLTGLVQHPRFGAGHRFRVLEVSLQSTCSEIIATVSDTPSLTSQTAHLLEEKGDKALGEDWLLEGYELGFDTIVEQMAAAAGMHAKEKREKTGTKSSSPSRPPSRRGNRPSDALSNVNIPVLLLYHCALPGQPLPGDLTVSQLLVLLKERGLPEGMSDISLYLKFKIKSANGTVTSDPKADADWLDIAELGQNVEPVPESVLLETPSLPSALQVFASVGGLALLAEHLPLLYPEVTRQGAPVDGRKEAGGSGAGLDWVTVENFDDICEETYEPIPASQGSVGGKQSLCAAPSIPPHSLVAFGLFLRLPGYAEVLLREKRKAQCLLRLVLGVTDDGEGGHILTLPVASSLPTLPFNVLKMLFDATPLSTDDGVLLRRMALEIGAVHLVLACLSVLSHHAPIQNIPGIHHEIIMAASQAACAIGTSAPAVSASKPTSDEKNQQYWAKGTGFGTGSTASYWDAEQALIRQRCEEEHVTCLLHVLASFINPGASSSLDHLDSDSDPVPLPPSLPELLAQSCLVPALCSYLRNDSVLDMARHVPLYRALLELLRGIAVCPMLVPLLLPQGGEEDSNVSVSSLLDKMKVCVDTYASRLKTNKKSKVQREDDDSGGLALLIPDIQATAKIVDTTIHKIKEKTVSEMEKHDECSEANQQGASTSDCSLEERYMSILRELQFDTYEIVVEEDGKLEFTVPHHYESNVKAAGEINNPSRARRLAQEAVTLSTSLPLSASSSVFVRCDEERLDVLKVLITGPADTPYANGCFEFDVYFPQDYPNTPPQINLETTGNHTVRFNPNLYNDGKVCLSILNTWHGRPEEKWNSQTSSFLQVLVSIQSLILVSEPYFNEPGYERSRGTASGTWCSKEYDANIRQATVKWAMLEMLKNPPPCFKEVIECHFWLKRQEIIHQVEEWIADLEANMNDKRVRRAIRHSWVALKHHFSQLKEEFAKMKPPESIPDAASEQLSSNCQADTERPCTSAEPAKVPVKEEQNQAMANTASSGQAMSSFNFVDVVELADEEFPGFISDTDSDVMDLTTPGPSELLNSLDNTSQPHVNMNSISPSSPSGSDNQQNAGSGEVQKTVHSNLYYL